MFIHVTEAFDQNQRELIVENTNASLAARRCRRQMGGVLRAIDVKKVSFDEALFRDAENYPFVNEQRCRQIHRSFHAGLCGRPKSVMSSGQALTGETEAIQFRKIVKRNLAQATQRAGSQSDAGASLRWASTSSAMLLKRKSKPGSSAGGMVAPNPGFSCRR